MAEGNRKDPRARVLNMTVRYKSATVDEFIENHSHDISRGGIFIKTRAPFPAGTLLKFEVRIAEDQRLMQGVGRVVWRREPERAEDGFPAGMGIKFIKTGEGAAELISQIIDARQGEESSFDTGSRENGADSGGRRSGLPPAPEVSEPPHHDAPSLQVESAPAGALAEGELRVSSPPKKRNAASSETRKVVLQGAAFDAPSSDKTPISTAARVVEAQVAAERAPSRPAPAAKDRGSIVNETTSPRARSASERKRESAAAQTTSPSVYGLVAILAVVALALLFVKLVRSPESEPAAPPVPAASTPTPAAPTLPSPPLEPAPPAPSTAAPVAETGEGAGERAALPPTTPAPAAEAPSAPVTPGAAARPGTAAPVPAPGAAASNAVTAAPGKPPAPAAPAAAAKPAAPPKPPAEAAPAPAKPKAAPKPAPSAATEPTVSIRPAAPEAEPTAPGGAGASNGAPAHPGEPAKKRPPTAAAPSEPEPAKPAPSPKPATPSDDNPY